MTSPAGPYALQPGESLEDLDMRGGSVLSLRVTGAESGGLVSIIEGVVLEGGPPLHVHPLEDEIVIVLEGTLIYRLGERSGELTAGGLLWFPRGIPHAIANHSGAVCRFLTVATPAGIEDLFRAQRDYIASLPAGVPPDPAAFDALPGAELRPIVGPPIEPGRG